MISILLQGKQFNITVIQAYAPTSNAAEADIEQFYENIQDLLELTSKKDVLFIIGGWNAKHYRFRRVEKELDTSILSMSQGSPTMRARSWGQE